MLIKKNLSQRSPKVHKSTSSMKKLGGGDEKGWGTCLKCWKRNILMLPLNETLQAKSGWEIPEKLGEE